MRDTVLTVHLAITGRVQGVGYRESLRAVASAVQVAGWVRNRANGSVEAVVQGKEKDVERVIVWCQGGPLGARVESVKSKPVEKSELFAKFVTMPTAD